MAVGCWLVSVGNWRLALSCWLLGRPECWCFIPFSYYYAGLALDIMDADLIVVIGSGLNDLHLNTWLKEARRKENPSPLLFVDYWENGLGEQRSENENKSIEMFHSLSIDTENLKESDYCAVDGWTISKHGSSAVWDKGLHALLEQPGSLPSVLKLLESIEG